MFDPSIPSPRASNSGVPMQRAIVLAAGRGSRLVGEQDLPKPLKQVAGVALLVRILRTLQTEGIREAVVILGDRGEHIRVGFEDAVTLPDGSSATSNAQLVEHAVRLGAALGRAPMPPDEARRLLR